MVQVDQAVTPQVSHSQVGRRILRATGALMLIQVVMRGFGLIEKMILGRLFGTSYLTDAYNAAKDIAFYIFQMVDQVVMHSFLPVFVQRLREQDEKDAWRLASTTINILMLIMAAVAIGGIAFAPKLLPFFVPNWFAHPDKYPADLVPLTIKLMRAMLVTVIFLATSSLTYCLLNSYKQFALPASADLALKGTVLVFALLFAKSWGPYALAVGFIFGAMAKVLVHGGGLRRQILNYRPVIDLRHVGLKQFALLALPLIISTGFSIFRQVMDTRFTSYLPEGSLSALKFARTLCDVPVQFFPFAFGIALFPFLADIAVAGDKTRLREMLMMATRMMILIFLPLGAMLIALRDPLVFTVYGSKAMLTTQPLILYALGMVVGALEIIVLQFFFAMSDTMRPSIVAILIIPLHIGASYLGIHYLGWGIMAIAGALLLSKGTKVIILYAMIRKKLLTLEGKRTLILIGKVIVALIPLIAVLLLGNHLMRHHQVVTTPESRIEQPVGTQPPALVTTNPPQLAPGTSTGSPTAEKPAKKSGGLKSKLRKVLALLPYVFFGLVGFLLYLGVLYLLRADEVMILIDRVRGKLKKRGTAAPAQPSAP